MGKITDSQIFEVLRTKIAPARLTQEMVDITNVAMSSSEGRQSVLDILDIDMNDEIICKPYRLDESTLRKVYPGANVAVIPFILKHAPKHGIVTKKQMCSFLANTLHESEGFNVLEENLNYSAKRLVEVFSKRLIPSLKAAKNIVRGGKRGIANALYNGRMGNRKGTDDGYNYAGKGPIMATGRNNYTKLEKLTGLPLLEHPELMLDLETGIIVSMTWWEANGCNEWAEKINVYSNGWELNTLDNYGRETNNYKWNYGMATLRRIVNGGHIGLNEVSRLFEKCMKHM